jgi:predicted glycosyltransferase
MNILFEINHPAHFHLLKNPINLLIRRGHIISILAKSNSPIPQLLSTQPHWNVLFVGKKGKGIVTKVLKQFLFTFQSIRIILSRKIDLCAGVSITMPQAAFLTGLKSLVLDDDDKKTTPVFAALSHTFATKILSPDSLRDNDSKTKYIYYPGLHELSYLHPDVFSPQKDVLSELNLAENEKIILLRFVDFKAHHDLGEKGLSNDQRKRLVEILSKKGRVIITSESKLVPELESYKQTVSPDKIHDLMAFASLYMGESQTMASEAAVLGVPAIRINTFKSRIAYLTELEEIYGLLYSYTPDEFDKAIEKINELLLPKSRQKWAERRKKLLEEKINVSDFITSEILKFEKT